MRGKITGRSEMNWYNNSVQRQIKVRVPLSEETSTSVGEYVEYNFPVSNLNDYGMGEEIEVKAFKVLHDGKTSDIEVN